MPGITCSETRNNKFICPRQSHQPTRVMSRISIKFDQAVIKKQNKKNNRRKNEGKDNPGKMKEKCLKCKYFLFSGLGKKRLLGVAEDRKYWAAVALRSGKQMTCC